MSAYKRPIAVAAIALASGVAATAAADSSQATARAGAADTSGNAAHATARTTGVAQARRAIVTARTAVPGSRPYDLERDHHRGAPVWEVKVAAGSQAPVEVLVSADGRRIVGQEQKRRPSADARAAQLARVGMTRALLIAGRRGSGALHEAEIDHHRGRTVWTAEFKRGRAETEVAVDATTAGVVYVRHDAHHD